MAKPIFIISIKDCPPINDQNRIRRVFEPLKEEYHVFTCFGADEMKFQLFSDKEIEPIELENLKELLKWQELQQNTVRK